MNQGLEGDDMYYIKKMRDIQDVRMEDHITKYDKLQAEMMKLSDDAVEAMEKIGKYDKKSKKIAEAAAAQNHTYKR